MTTPPDTTAPAPAPRRRGRPPGTKNPPRPPVRIVHPPRLRPDKLAEAMQTARPDNPLWLAVLDIVCDEEARARDLLAHPDTLASDRKIAYASGMSQGLLGLLDRLTAEANSATTRENKHL